MDASQPGGNWWWRKGLSKNVMLMSSDTFSPGDRRHANTGTVDDAKSVLQGLAAVGSGVICLQPLANLATISFMFGEVIPGRGDGRDHRLYEAVARYPETNWLVGAVR
jgi:hypothetical protein